MFPFVGGLLKFDIIAIRKLSTIAFDACYKSKRKIALRTSQFILVKLETVVPPLGN